MWNGVVNGFRFLEVILLILGAMCFLPFWARTRFWLPKYDAVVRDGLADQRVNLLRAAMLGMLWREVNAKGGITIGAGKSGHPLRSGRGVGVVRGASACSESWPLFSAVSSCKRPDDLFG